jgi:hypothetical protein
MNRCKDNAGNGICRAAHRYFLWVVVLVVGTGCSEISYKEPQPADIKPLDRIPAKLHGTYIVKDEGQEVNDLLIVFEKGYRIQPKDSMKQAEVFFLSDSLVLKYYRGYYFVNYRDDFVWHLRVLKRGKNGDMSLMEMESVSSHEPTRKEFLSRLSKEIEVIETQADSSTIYLIDPTPRQLLNLVRKGWFKEESVFVKEKSVR